MLPTLKTSAILCGIIASSKTAGVVADALTSGTQITLGDALTVGGVVIGGAWYLSRRLQKMEDAIKHQGIQTDNFHEQNSGRLDAIEKTLNIKSK